MTPEQDNLRLALDTLAKHDPRRGGSLLAPGFAARRTYLARDVCLVSLEGEFDLAAVPALRDELLKILSDGRSDVVVDLTGVTLIDSATLGVLLRALRAANAQRRSLSLVARDERILKTFRITALDRLFSIYGSLEEASGTNGRDNPNAPLASIQSTHPVAVGATPPVELPRRPC